MDDTGKKKLWEEYAGTRSSYSTLYPRYMLRRPDIADTSKLADITCRAAGDNSGTFRCSL